jgi:hypothetical protein
MVPSDTRPRRRLSLSFDTDRTLSHWINHAAAVALYFAHYNFYRVHRTLHVEQFPYHKILKPDTTRARPTTYT